MAYKAHIAERCCGGQEPDPVVEVARPRPGDPLAVLVGKGDGGFVQLRPHPAGGRGRLGSASAEQTAEMGREPERGRAGRVGVDVEIERGQGVQSGMAARHEACHGET